MQDDGEADEPEDKLGQAGGNLMPKPRHKSQPTQANGQDSSRCGDSDRTAGADTTAHTPPLPDSDGKEADQLEKLRQAKALIESIHFPTASVRRAAGELVEQIGSSLLGPKKPIPTGKWKVRALGYMDPDKGAIGKALAEGVVGGTVSTIFKIGLRTIQIIDLEIDDSPSTAGHLPSNGSPRKASVAAISNGTTEQKQASVQETEDSIDCYQPAGLDDL